jgi:hypothetical protein
MTMAYECFLCGEEANLYVDFITLSKTNDGKLVGKREGAPICIDCYSEQGFKEWWWGA